MASRANLSLDAVTEANGAITLKASAQAVKLADAKNADVFIALYENKLVSKVNAGENSGRESKSRIMWCATFLVPIKSTVKTNLAKIST